MVRWSSLGDRGFARFLHGTGLPEDVQGPAGLAKQLRVESDFANQLGRPLSLLAGHVHPGDGATDLSGAALLPGLLAEDLNRWTRRADSVAQINGDVFVILLPDTGPAGAVMVAKRLARAVQRHLDDQDLVGTVHFGHATYPDDGRDLDALLEAAIGLAIGQTAAPVS